jgi:hypothetical protein
MPCRSVELEVRPRHDPVNITRVVLCHWSVEPIVSGRAKAQIDFKFLFFLQFFN